MSKIDLKEIKREFPYWTHAQYMELIRVVREKPSTDYVPFQLCPKCNGEGDIEMSGYSTIIARVTCDVCSGRKIIPMHPIKKEK